MATGSRDTCCRRFCFSCLLLNTTASILKFRHCVYRFRQGLQGGPNKEKSFRVLYKGEMGFFDFYTIPLAKKVKECGVFGVSSDVYLNYAEKNRREWETRGQEAVASKEEEPVNTTGLE
jgi:hypothetical protein